MKKIILTVAFLAVSLGAMAQPEQQVNDDQLQQQAPRETQKEVETAAAREARKKEAEAKQKEADQKAIEQAEAKRKEAELEKEKQEKAKAKSQKK